MASIKFEIGFNFGGKACWKIIPPELQVNTNGFEYYWCFEHKYKNEDDLVTICNYINGYFSLLVESLSNNDPDIFEDIDCVMDIFTEKRYFEPMDFKVGSVSVKCDSIVFEDMVYGE